MVCDTGLMCGQQPSGPALAMGPREGTWAEPQHLPDLRQVGGPGLTTAAPTGHRAQEGPRGRSWWCGPFPTLRSWCRAVSRGGRTGLPQTGGVQAQSQWSVHPTAPQDTPLHTVPNTPHCTQHPNIPTAPQHALRHPSTPTVLQHISAYPTAPQHARCTPAPLCVPHCTPARPLYSSTSLRTPLHASTPTVHSSPAHSPSCPSVSLCTPLYPSAPGVRCTPVHPLYSSISLCTPLYTTQQYTLLYPNASTVHCTPAHPTGPEPQPPLQVLPGVGSRESPRVPLGSWSNAFILKEGLRQAGLGLGHVRGQTPLGDAHVSRGTTPPPSCTAQQSLKEGSPPLVPLHSVTPSWPSSGQQGPARPTWLVRVAGGRVSLLPPQPPGDLPPVHRTPGPHASHGCCLLPPEVPAQAQGSGLPTGTGHASDMEPVSPLPGRLWTPIWTGAPGPGRSRRGRRGRGGGRQSPAETRPREVEPGCRGNPRSRLHFSFFTSCVCPPLPPEKVSYKLSIYSEVRVQRV